jgi:hypothetical protein
VRAYRRDEIIEDCGQGFLANERPDRDTLRGERSIG